MSSRNPVLDFLKLLVAHHRELTEERNRKQYVKELEGEVERLDERLRGHPFPDVVQYVAEEAGLDPIPLK